MRHLLAAIVTYALAGLLVGGAALFAWARTAQVVISDEQTVVARFEPAPAHAFAWRALGAASYERNCANCHGERGRGWDQYPSIRHAAALALPPGGREYLVDLHLYGLASGRGRGVPMPPMGHMPNVELAAVINHVLTTLSDAPVGGPPGAGVPLFTPAEVAARRGQRLSPGDVYDTYVRRLRAAAAPAPGP